MPAPNVYQQSSNLFNQAAAGPNINQFMNPYTNQVINRSMADLERQRRTQINSTGADATAAGAFGGSRHGVAEAQTNLGFGQMGAQMASGLRQQGFDTALQAAQDNQRMQSDLSQQGFNFGQSINNQQFQQGQQQQMLNQQLIDAARGQYGGFTSNPQNALATILSSMGYMPNQSTQSSTQNPGVLGTIGAILPFF
jgi:O-acetylhomoserine/O-acetylserine sulfhydrylase-like pyridoxal-dependent enzyme